MVDVGEQLQVLLSQGECVYQTSDYITRMQAQAGMVEHDEEEREIQDITMAVTGTGTGTAACTTSSSSSFDTDYDSLSSSPTNTKKHRLLESSSHAVLAEQECHHTDQCQRTATTTSPTTTRRSTLSSCINKNWREQICKWAYDVVDHFDLNREVVSIAMSHLDRYLGIYTGTVDKNLFQLLSMTCLYLSIKLNEHEHLLIQGSISSMETILHLSNGFFKLEEMENMERELLHTLQWRVHPPTGQVYVNQFLKYLSVDHHQELQDLASYTMELAVMDYYFVSYKSSDIAIAALLNSIDRLSSGHGHRQNNNRNNTRALQQMEIDLLSFTSQFLIDVYSPSFIACRDRLSLIYTQANKENEPPQEVQAAAPVPVQKILEAQQRTISPTSVMAVPHTDKKPDVSVSSRELYQHHHQSQFDSSTHDDTNITNDYFLDDVCM